jgi:hypothetical protein
MEIGTAIRSTFLNKKKEHAMADFLSKPRAQYLWSLASALFCVSLAFGPSSALASDGLTRHSQNILIADQFNNRVIEINPSTHQIVRQFAGSARMLDSGHRLP